MSDPVVHPLAPVAEEPRVIHLEQETLPHACFVESSLPLGQHTGLFIISKSAADALTALAGGCGSSLHEVVQAACESGGIEEALERLLHPTLKDLRAHPDIRVERGYVGYASCIIPLREPPHATIPPREVLMVLSTEAFSALVKKAVALGDRPGTFEELMRTAIERDGFTRKMMVNLVGEEALREPGRQPSPIPTVLRPSALHLTLDEHAAE